MNNECENMEKETAVDRLKVFKWHFPEVTWEKPLSGSG